MQEIDFEIMREVLVTISPNNNGTPQFKTFNSVGGKKILPDGDDFIAGRDPLGIKPLYYGIDERGRYYFASEMKSIADQCKTFLQIIFYYLILYSYENSQMEKPFFQQIINFS